MHVFAKFVVFPRAFLATFILALFIALSPGASTAGGGKDPSLTKPTTELSCSELSQAMRELDQDFSRMQRDLDQKDDGLEFRKEKRAEVEADVKKLKAAVSAESDPSKKQKLKKKLANQKAFSRRLKHTINSYAVDIRDMEREFEQALKRYKRFQQQRKKLGC